MDAIRWGVISIIMTMKNGFVKELESKMLNAVGNFAKATSFVTGRSYNRTPGYPNTNHGTLIQPHARLLQPRAHKWDLQQASV